MERKPPKPKRWRQAEFKLARAARGPKPRGGAFVSGNCARCEMWFTVYSGTGVALYCSELCADRRVNTGRKAREAGRKLTPKRRLAVFERDEWVCQLCWEDIDPALKVPDPWAGTIDHAIPLACDGEHNEDNWQAAHFKCNSMKGANAAY